MQTQTRLKTRAAFARDPRPGIAYRRAVMEAAASRRATNGVIRAVRARRRQRRESAAAWGRCLAVCAAALTLALIAHALP